MLMRAELARPGLQILSEEQYNQLFTMHGSIMMFLFAPAAAFGFTNFIMPLQIGAPDMSFPRLNAFSYWLYLFGGTTAAAGFLTPDGAASFGWFAYAPLNDVIHSPSIGSDLWIVGLIGAVDRHVQGAVGAEPVDREHAQPFAVDGAARAHLRIPPTRADIARMRSDMPMRGDATGDDHHRRADRALAFVGDAQLAFARMPQPQPAHDLAPD